MPVSETRSLSDLRKQIAQAMQVDRFRLRRSLEAIERSKQGDQPFDRNLHRFTQALDESLKKRADRAARVPTIKFNEELPIAARREEITAAIAAHQVVILCGETGSGKSTQLPLILLQMGRGLTGLIGHTQPRRIAARSVATRVAEELGSSVGDAVGFKVRFTDSTGPRTFIKLMTDGILLAESQNDRFFDQYDTLIIDEAHERSLNIDFLLGRLKQLLPKRPDLKVIITSATIDAARFAEHFGTPGRPAPVIEVAGRTYPVEVRYRPLVDDERGELDDDDDNSPDDSGGPNAARARRRSEPDVQRSILDAVDELGQIDQGDILIFMPTERDILETAKSLRGRLLPERNRGRITEILPLYARLSDKDQHRIFEAHPHRRIVISTNVAESSLTVPGIHYVIDSGTARISRYSARSRMQRLPVEPISKASANQRAGRCGRIGPGVCIRLYSEDDFNQREPFTPPEIQRTNLASVILQTKSLRLGAIEEFPFLEPPKTGTINDGYRMLFELGALDEKNELTEVGQKLSRLPVDPRVGRIILAGADENCLAEILIIAAALELQDPRDRPIDHQQAADQAHAKFKHEDSDFLSYLKLWDFFLGLQGSLGRSKLRKACQQNFLSYNRMREWVDIHRQLCELINEHGMRPGKRREDASDSIHRALLTGFLGNIALLDDKQEYQAANNQKVVLWPGSGLFSKKYKWVVAGELVETTRRYLRTVARINPDWIEPLAGHLMKRTYSDPVWDGKAGATMAFEKVTLFGLPIVARRRVNFARIDENVSREQMIQHGLVEGDFETDLPFFVHNQRLLEELETLQVRTRRGDLIADDEVRYDFYDKRIPPDVCDGFRLRKWLKSIDRKQPKILHLTREDLRREGAQDVTNQEFPDRIQVQQMNLALNYHLDPGSEEDGVTLDIPREALNQLDQRRLGWLVPGLLEEKVAALIKSLPKDKRRMFVPATDTAKAVLKKLKFGEGDFEGAVARILDDLGPERVQASDFDTERLPNHLRMNVRVLGPKGESLGVGRNVDTLRQQLGGAAAASFSQISNQPWNRDNITDWSFADLPTVVSVKSAGIDLKGYPTLVDRGASVSLRLLDEPLRSAIQTRSGLRRLAVLALRKPVKWQIDHLPNLSQWTMSAALLGCTATFQADLIDLIIDRAFFAEKAAYPRTLAQYQARLEETRSNLAAATQDVIGLLNPLFAKYTDLRRALADSKSPLFAYAVNDVKAQIDGLTGANFLIRTPWPWLLQYPRYFEAITRRLKKLVTNGVPRDQKALSQVNSCIDRYQRRTAEHAPRELYDPELDLYRWMIEELRVSLFAQELGTAIPVSDVRMEKQWEKVKA